MSRNREQRLRLEAAIKEVSKDSWIGSVLQVMRIVEVDNIPTAGVSYHKETRSITLCYNPEFYANLTIPEIIAVSVHELGHIFEGHIFMYKSEANKDKHNRINWAMDLILNQKIENLPKGALKIEDFTDSKGNPFPPNLSTEEYYDLLENSTYNGSGDLKTLDEHTWEEFNKEDIIKASIDLAKRAQSFHEKRTGQKSPHLSDFLNTATRTLSGIDFRQILNQMLRNELPGNDFKKTWSKQSRRYGKMAKGHIFKPSPVVYIQGDTSGSMTIDTINDMLEAMTQFLISGAKKINLSLFHNEVYFNSEYKKGFKFKPADLQSGGTDLQPSIDMIYKDKPELVVFMTDGYFSMPNVPKGFNTKLLFLIKEGGNLNHPMVKYGRTIEYKSR